MTISATESIGVSFWATEFLGGIGLYGLDGLFFANGLYGLSFWGIGLYGLSFLGIGLYGLSLLASDFTDFLFVLA